jgi:dUTPase
MILASYEISPQDYKPAYNGESAGLDLYNAGSDIVIPSCVDPDEQGISKTWKTLVPTGVRVALPVNTVALLRERGSIVKTSLSLRAGVIDPGYTGEIFVNMINMSLEPVTILSGQRLPVQLVVVPFLSNFTLLDNSSYDKFTDVSARGDNKIGSSD